MMYIPLLKTIEYLQRDSVVDKVGIMSAPCTCKIKPGKPLEAVYTIYLWCMYSVPRVCFNLNAQGGCALGSSSYSLAAQPLHKRGAGPPNYSSLCL